jgi:RNA polymerase sigma-70 factor (ECF subfamily)
MSEPEYDFRQIYEAFRPRIVRYLTRLAGEAEAEDLAQEVFVKVDRGLGAFRGDSQLSTWIYRIATRAALDRLRSLQGRGRPDRQLPATPIEEAAEGIWAGDEPPAEQGVIRKEMNGCIRSIVDTLPTNYRSAVVLSELEGLRDAEIAEILGIRLQTAKMRLHRGRLLLKEALSRACVFYRDERNELACDRKGGEAPLVRIGEGVPARAGAAAGNLPKGGRP